MRFLRGVSLGYSVVQVAPELGISRATLYRWLAEDPSLKTALEESRRFACALRETHVGSRRRVELLVQRFGLKEAHIIVTGKAMKKFRRRRPHIPGGVARLLPEYLFR
jgi:transposase-like protein